MSADLSQVSNGYFHGARNFVVTGSHLTEVIVLFVSCMRHANNAKLLDNQHNQLHCTCCF